MVEPRSDKYSCCEGSSLPRHVSESKGSLNGGLLRIKLKTRFLGAVGDAGIAAGGAALRSAGLWKKVSPIAISTLAAKANGNGRARRNRGRANPNFIRFQTLSRPDRSATLS